MKLIVGLGNPGSNYEKTRHNVGFQVIDLFIKEAECSPRSNASFKSIVAECRTIDGKLLVIKPATFMNNSGEAVHTIAQFYKIAPKDIWVVHDDKDIDIGKIKINIGGGSAGHNGINSLIQELGSDEFVRFRVGIKNDTVQGQMDTASFVLAQFAEEETNLIQTAREHTVQAIKKALEIDVSSAQNEFNR